MSLLTLTTISLNRLLALLLGLRYRQVVTLKRTYVTVSAFWFVSIVVSLISFWYSAIWAWYSRFVIPLCLVTSAYSYTRIFLRLRHHQTQVQDNVAGQPNQTTPLNIARYRKTVSSALWLQLTLVVCYLPPIVVLSMVRSEIQDRLSLFYYPTVPSLFQLVIEPDSLSLEDQRSETSSEDDNQTNLLFIKLTVVQSMFWLSTDSSVLFERRIYIFHLTVVN